MEELKVNLTSDQKELIIRTGEAQKIKVPIPEKFTGTIVAPIDYVNIRKADPQKAIVEYNRKKMQITYYADPTDSEAAVITGTVKMNPELEKFGINAEKMYSPKQLADFLKLNRIYFSDRDAQSIIVTKLNDLTATVNKEIAANQDTRGNAKATIDRKVTTNIPENFALSMPLIVGGEKKDFLVEIGLDPRDAGISCWLASVELAELMKEFSDEFIDKNVAEFIELGLVCIEN